MKLISMTDFVLEHPATTDYEWQLSKHLKYANFLKQPLTLGMFIPCINDKPLDCDGTDGDGYVIDEIMHKEYQQAKERVLFKDFKIEICNNEIAVKMEGWGSILKSEMTDLTIEFLTKRTPTLTTTAIKQIGL